MHNWWIAALEHFGLISREEAEHISSNIRLGIHRENYKEAYDELEAILGDAKVKTEPLIKQLEARVISLEAYIDHLQSSAKQQLEANKPAPTEVNKSVASKTKA